MKTYIKYILTRILPYILLSIPFKGIGQVPTFYLPTGSNLLNSSSISSNQYHIVYTSSSDSLPALSSFIRTSISSSSVPSVQTTSSLNTVEAGLSSYGQPVLIGDGRGVDTVLSYMKQTTPSNIKRVVLISDNPIRLFDSLKNTGYVPDGSKVIIINRWDIRNSRNGVPQTIKVPVYNPYNRFDSVTVNLSTVIK